jgi:hypothetical protein
MGPVLQLVHPALDPADEAMEAGLSEELCRSE